MEMSIKESGNSIKYQVMAYINGTIIEHIKDIGLTTKCMDMDATGGQTEGDTKANTRMTNNMDSGSSPIPMAAPIKGSGLLVYNKARAGLSTNPPGA